MKNDIFMIVLVLCVCDMTMSKFVGKITIPNPEYDAECQKRLGIRSVAMPASECDIERYIMCEKQVADSIAKCPTPLKFNPNTTWCETGHNIPLPQGCAEAPVATYAKSCVEPGARMVPFAISCKWYVQCMGAGYNDILMPCPDWSYFTPHFERCIDTKVYGADIPAAWKKECDIQDPYLTTSAPAATTPAAIRPNGQ
uniref:Chitin-binding type-2 domain-containing protein n=1 Tax=Arion vulgaris TaxID=1028688 RepID=A0A0B6Y922_9EUPU